MDASKYQFENDEIMALHSHRDNQLDARLKVRFISLLMLAEGLELVQISSIIGKSIKTIEKWYFEYATKGIDSLNSFQYKPKKSYWGIRLTPVATTCSIWLWTRTIRRRCLNSTTASVRRRCAGNICTSCVGLTGFIARVVAMRNIG